MAMKLASDNVRDGDSLGQDLAIHAGVTRGDEVRHHVEATLALDGGAMA